MRISRPLLASRPRSRLPATANACRRANGLPPRVAGAGEFNASRLPRHGAALYCLYTNVTKTMKLKKIKNTTRRRAGAGDVLHARVKPRASLSDK